MPIRAAARLVPAAVLAAGAALADPAWQPIGSAAGVEAYSARTDAGVVRIGFRNARDEPVRIAIAETLIWCGGSAAGRGRSVDTSITPFVLDAGATRWSPEWSRLCTADRYYVEFRSLTIEPAP